MNCGFESRIDDVEAVLELGSNLDLMGETCRGILRKGGSLKNVWKTRNCAAEKKSRTEELKWIIRQKGTVSSPLDSKICVSYLSETYYYYLEGNSTSVCRLRENQPLCNIVGKILRPRKKERKLCVPARTSF